MRKDMQNREPHPVAGNEKYKGKNLGKIARELLTMYSDYIETKAGGFIKVLELKKIQGKNRNLRILVKLDDPNKPGLLGWGSAPPDIYEDIEESGEVVRIKLFRETNDSLVEDVYERDETGFFKGIELQKPVSEKNIQKLYTDLENTVPATLVEP